MRLTQEALAELSGVSVRTIRAIESGQVVASRHQTVEMLARALRLDDEAWVDLRTPVPVPEPVPPAQLPRDARCFTGRDGEIACLDAMLGGRRLSAASVAVVSGTAGVGKTALAVHWAHRVRNRFPDGQLYVKLRGYHAHLAPTPPVDALVLLLRGLGVDADRMPAGLEEAAALYRSLLADRSVLVLLDDAASVEQVRPLLPAGRECLVLVTSRNRLAGLVAEVDAVPVPLDPLTGDEALALVTGLVGAERVAAEPGPAVELARLCGWLPLAIRVAAAHVVTGRYERLDTMVADLATQRLATLSFDDDEQLAVGTAFRLSYRALPEPDRRLFRRLGLLPGADATAEAAAALAGTDGEAATRLLRRLTARCLVDELRPGRFQQHELVRLYAAERALADDDAEECAHALDRLYAWYVETASDARQVLFPHASGRLVTPDSAAGRRFVSTAQAVDWLDSEASNLVAAVTGADPDRRGVLACSLADALRDYFFFRGGIADWQRVADTALSIAHHRREPRLEAAARLMCAHPARRLDRFDDAHRHCRIAAMRSEEAGWADGRLAALSAAGSVCTEFGRMAEAVDAFGRVIADESCDDASRATGLVGLMIGYWGVGRSDDAVDCGLRALESMRRLASRAGEAAALVYLGYAYHSQGRLDRATEAVTAGSALCAEAGITIAVAEAEVLLGTIAWQRGESEPAERHAATALDLARELRHARIEAEALNLSGAVALAAGNVAVALELQEQAEKLALRHDRRHTAVNVAISLATTHRCSGNLPEAVRYAERALDDSRRHGYGAFAVRARRIQATLTRGVPLL